MALSHKNKCFLKQITVRPKLFDYQISESWTCRIKYQI